VRSRKEIKRGIFRTINNRLVNPVVRPLVRRGPLDGAWALLETKGRKSGQPRATPVGNGLRGNTFWVVTEHGYASHYVKNIQADPRVRVKIGGRWRSGTAHLMPELDPRQKLRELGRPVNDALLLAIGTEQLVVRVDLDD
jgi:deazaflavin-dependent oxidoreductase (nitroreductase family)